MASKPKFLFVTGGVVSSLGKGILSASLGISAREQKNKGDYHEA
jgi:CTP synthase (UTP-ammonia lyase)